MKLKCPKCSMEFNIVYDKDFYCDIYYKALEDIRIGLRYWKLKVEKDLEKAKFMPDRKEEMLRQKQLVLDDIIEFLGNESFKVDNIKYQRT